MMQKRQTGWLLIGILLSGTGMISKGQGQAQAQTSQDSMTQRVTRAEDQILDLNKKSATLEQISADVSRNLQELARMNGIQNERITSNEQALQKIITTAEAAQQAQEQEAESTRTFIAIVGAVILLGGFLLDLRREKRYQNGHNPITKPVESLEKKINEGQEETSKLLRELIERQPKRRV